MPFIISVKSEFCAAVALEMEGPCSNLHGHTYNVTAEFSFNDVANNGISIDYQELSGIFEKLVLKLDHCHLNQHEWFQELSPSSENIAKVLFIKLENNNLPVTSVSISENQKCRICYVKE